MDKFKRLETLKALITLGCPIPIFTFAKKNPLPINCRKGQSGKIITTPPMYWGIPCGQSTRRLPIPSPVMSPLSLAGL